MKLVVSIVAAVLSLGILSTSCRNDKKRCTSPVTKHRYNTLKNAFVNQAGVTYSYDATISPYVSNNPDAPKDQFLSMVLVRCDPKTETIKRFVLGKVPRISGQHTLRKIATDGQLNVLWLYIDYQDLCCTGMPDNPINNYILIDSDSVNNRLTLLVDTINRTATAQFTCTFVNIDSPYDTMHCHSGAIRGSY